MSSLDSQVRRSRLRWCVGAVLGGLCLLPGLGVLTARLLGPPPLDRFEQAAAELKGRGLGPGAHPGLDLPARFRSLTHDGKADAFTTKDGRLLVLFKTSLGWKGNYAGLVYAGGGLSPADLGADPYGRKTVRMGLPDAAAPVLGRELNGRWHEVFFDLG